VSSRLLYRLRDALTNAASEQRFKDIGFQWIAPPAAKK
jgi:hypothetical protein